MTISVKLIGLSGPSSAGKSTISRVLYKILSNVSIIYQDDFYLEDSKIPKTNDGLEDWDCPEAFDLEKLKKVLEETKATGKVPEHFSQEHENKIGPDGLTEVEISEIRKKIGGKLDNVHIVILDGIMLYQENSPILDLFDLRLFFTAPSSVLKRRREQRSGYATIEGFWADPPGYFNKIVWPGFQRTHGYLYNDGNADQDLNMETLRKLKIQTPSMKPRELTEFQLLSWTVTEILQKFA